MKKISKSDFLKKVLIGVEEGKDKDVKFIQNKISWRTASWEALKWLALLHTCGDNKYFPGNWQNCDPEEGIRKYTDALQRHFCQWMEGEIFDPDTGMPHMVQIMWNAEVVTYFMMKAGYIPSVDEKYAFAAIQAVKDKYGKA